MVFRCELGEAFLGQDIVFTVKVGLIEVLWLPEPFGDKVWYRIGKETQNMKSDSMKDALFSILKVSDDLRNTRRILLT